MATRNYKRDKNGRFASSGNAVNTTTGRAGGFSNAQFRSRVQTARAAQNAQASKGGALRRAARTASKSPAFRAALVRNGVKVTVPAVAVGILAAQRGNSARRALLTSRGRSGLQKRYNQRQLAKLLASERNLANLRSTTRAIVARPGGGGSKSGRPTLRYAASNIKGPSARLRLNTAKRALSGRI